MGPKESAGSIITVEEKSHGCVRLGNPDQGDVLEAALRAGFGRNERQSKTCCNG
ncbi:MAG: hypothetical protein MEQ07_04400 [Aquimonas sp.]|nr:hypothetical protein [Aquimonas sp.]